MAKAGGAAPTGCYKCGRPGHWSRDCPSSSSSIQNPNSSNSTSYKTTNSNSKTIEKSTEKPKKAPRTRPKLTPELLLSNDGLGYILRHFPRAFRYRGRGHEVSDLGHLIGLYAQWHSHLLPYYSFHQFVHKVEQVGTTRRVKMCIKDLREKVANGGDLTKLHESSVEHDDINRMQDTTEAINSDEPIHYQGDASLNSCDANDMQDDILYEKAVEEPSKLLQSEKAAGGDSNKEQLNQGLNPIRSSSGFQMTEEQRARMEDKRLKALEKAAARSRLTRKHDWFL